MKLNFFLSMYMFMFSCFMVTYYYKHMLVTLISLEYLMISVYFNMYIIMVSLQMNIYLIMIFLVMSVCEGALGLTLIVLLTRFSGNDYLNSLSLIKW